MTLFKDVCMNKYVNVCFMLLLSAFISFQYLFGVHINPINILEVYMILAFGTLLTISIVAFLIKYIKEII